LFLHGTFSATASAFAGLAGSDSFDRLVTVYGGKAILVACPNEGTPLATPSHIRTAAEWIANLIDATPAGALVDAKTIALWLS
jgi:hypothetical protein